MRCRKSSEGRGGRNLITVDGNKKLWEMGEPMQDTGKALEALMAVDGKLMIIKSCERWGELRQWVKGS